jgi:hypothetical protein
LRGERSVGVGGWGLVLDGGHGWSEKRIEQENSGAVDRGRAAFGWLGPSPWRGIFLLLLFHWSTALPLDCGRRPQ